MSCCLRHFPCCYTYLIPSSQIHLVFKNGTEESVKQVVKFCIFSEIICCELYGYTELIISKTSRDMNTSLQGKTSPRREKGKGEFSVWILRLLSWKQNYLILDLLKGVICHKYSLKGCLCGGCISYFEIWNIWKIQGILCHIFLWIWVFFQKLKKKLMTEAALWEKKGSGKIAILNSAKQESKRDKDTIICNRCTF